MYTYDEIIASGYYVFREELTTHVICNFLVIMNIVNFKLDSRHSKFVELKRIFEFDVNNLSYKLRDDCKMEDIKDFIKEDLVIVFQKIENCMKKEDEKKGKQYVKTII